MKRILIILCMSFFSLYASELNWAKTYKEAMLIAKKENKNVMLLITTPTCRWCRKLETETLTDESIIKRMNKDYISVHVNRDDGSYPKDLNAPGVPTTYFLNDKGEAIIKRVIGYWNSEDYLSFLDDVDYKLGRKEY